MKLKKGDNVVMLSGKDRGKNGKILRVFPEDNRLIVEGLNLVKKIVRARKQGQKSQAISKERMVSADSVAMVCKACGKPTRIGYKFTDERKEHKVRVCKKCGIEA